jgi:hypothetical protein
MDKAAAEAGAPGAVCAKNLEESKEEQWDSTAE